MAVGARKERPGNGANALKGLNLGRKKYIRQTILYFYSNLKMYECRPHTENSHLHNISRARPAREGAGRGVVRGGIYALSVLLWPTLKRRIYIPPTQSRLAPLRRVDHFLLISSRFRLLVFSFCFISFEFWMLVVLFICLFIAYGRGSFYRCGHFAEWVRCVFFFSFRWPYCFGRNCGLFYRLFDVGI